MTFQALKERVVLDAFPAGGAPENLVSVINTYVLSALIEIQRAIPCFRVRHADVYPSCRTFWHCGTSVITAPRGKILRVYTVENRDWCLPAVYNPASMADLRRFQAKFRAYWSSDYFDAPNSGTDLPMGFDVPNTTSDAISGRAKTGLYAFDAAAQRLYLAPWIQSTESIVVEWQGIKRSWADADLVSDDEDFIRLVRLFVELEYGRKWGCEDLRIREGAWAEARADAMVTCNEESQLHGQPASDEEYRLLAATSFSSPTITEEEPESTVYISIVGDTGTGDAYAEAVADAITAANPDGSVVIAGDAKYPPNTALTALAPYQDYIDRNALRVALGNHDQDDELLGSDVTTYVNNPENGRYFTYKVGPVSIFVVNSGLNTSGDLVEPDGNYDGSKQQSRIRAAILRDTNPWKIVVLHHPPYTSSANYYPGLAAVRWVSELPVHAVIAGHSHQYERLVVHNRIHLVVGTGGKTLYDFNSTPYPGSVTRIKDYGFLNVVATCDSCRIDFIDTDGTTQDTVTLPDDPPLAPE